MWNLDLEGRTVKFRWDIRAVSSGQQRGAAGGAEILRVRWWAMKVES